MTFFRFLMLTEKSFIGLARQIGTTNAFYLTVRNLKSTNICNSTYKNHKKLKSTRIACKATDDYQRTEYLLVFDDHWGNTSALVIASTLLRGVPTWVSRDAIHVASKYSVTGLAFCHEANDRSLEFL